MNDSALMNARAAAAYCSRSVATWWRYHASAKIPKATKLGGGTFWNRQELVTWVSAGCPERDEWEKIKKEAKK